MKFIRTGLVIAALAVFPCTAHAWPIAFTWQLSDRLLPQSLQPGAPLGVGQLGFPVNPENGLYPTINGGAFGTGNYMNPYLSSLGNVTLSGYTPPEPLTLSQQTLGFTQFGMNVTVTDTMSGQSGTITTFGAAYTIWTNQGNGSWALESSIGGGPQSLRLGNNLYTAWIPLESNTPNSTAQFSAPIDLSVTPLATPEPGTLALAACGLSLVGFRVRRLARGSTN